jgi:hypothetical protein
LPLTFFAPFNLLPATAFSWSSSDWIQCSIADVVLDVVLLTNLLHWKTSKGWKKWATQLSLHYKKVSHSVFTTKIHWGALSQISGVFWI